MQPKKNKNTLLPPPVIDNPIEVMFRKMLEELRQELKNNEPFSILDSNPRDVSLKDIKAKLSLFGLKISGLHEFVVNKVTVPSPLEMKLGELWLKYSISVPHLHVAGKYEAEGTHKKVEVKNVGDFQGDILFYKNAGFMTFFEDEDEALQVDEYKIKLSSLGINIDQTGLNFGALKMAELKPLVDTKLHEYLQKMWKEWSKKVGDIAKEKLNKLLRRYNKDRAAAAVSNREMNEKEQQTREQREEEIRKCKEVIRQRAEREALGHPLSRDQSLAGWMCPQPTGS